MRAAKSFLTFDRLFAQFELLQLLADLDTSLYVRADGHSDGYKGRIAKRTRWSRIPFSVHPRDR
jgi:hypothetical protein